MMKINKILIFVMMFVMLSLGVFAQTYVSTYDIIGGSYDSGNIESLKYDDDDALIISETNEEPGFSVNFNFDTVSSIDYLEVHVDHDGGSGTHVLEIRMYNYEVSDFVTVAEFDLSNSDYDNLIKIVQGERFINGTESIVNFIHRESGNQQHEFVVEHLNIFPLGEIVETEESLCPVTVTENLNKFLVVVVLAFLFMLAFSTKQAILGILASFGLMGFGISIVGCFIALGSIVIGFSVILLFIFLFTEY